MQDMEDMCLLLTSFMSFVDLPFQEHQMIEKHHMDQNPYISSLCPKPGAVIDNMTWGDDMAKSSCPTDPRWGRSAELLGRPARVWHQWNYAFNMCHVKSVGRGSEVGKSVQLRNLANLDGRPAWQVGPRAPLSPKAPTYPAINTPPTPPGRKCEFSLQSASKFNSSRVEREARFWGSEDILACREPSE
jgi:hypothetical protein